ncbi:hypothetical protein VTN77DRAFT_7412 [Rasamsonia byssochlamydoides]|uniref:uncharacterized protein n=1 Tax=Rasamsonia byssochlamydoides TaxID=89139 RepID=UPI0037428162
MASQCEVEQNGPGAEFSNPERRHLIDLLNSALTGGAGVYNLPPALWAALWLSDIAKLRLLVQTAEINPDYLRGTLQEKGIVQEVILKPWNQGVRQRSARLSVPNSAQNTSIETESQPFLSPAGQPLTPERQRARPLQDNPASTRQPFTPQHQREENLFR